MDADTLAMMQAVDDGLSIEDVVIPDSCLDAMHDDIINRTNEVVGCNDYLICGGDLSNGNCQQTEEIMKRINCRNCFLVWGNHDDPDFSYLFNDCFERLHVMVENQLIVVDHYPSRSWYNDHRGSWMLYGHVHGRFDNEDRRGLNKREETIIEHLIDQFASQNDSLSEFMKNTIKASICSELGARAVSRMTTDIGFDTWGKPVSFTELKNHFSHKPRYGNQILTQDLLHKNGLSSVGELAMRNCDENDRRRIIDAVRKFEFY